MSRRSAPHDDSTVSFFGLHLHCIHVVSPLVSAPYACNVSILCRQSVPQDIVYKAEHMTGVHGFSEDRSCQQQAASGSRRPAPNLEDLLGVVLQHMQPLRQVAQVVQRNLCA
jgi:hypothetical protein